MRFQTKSHKYATLGMLLGIAILCGYVEMLIPFSVGVPGIKLGLANIVIVIALYTIGIKEAALISITKIFLSGFLFGNISIIFYSLAGGILSFVVMVLLKKVLKLNIISVSCAGGIFHNLGQLLLAMIVVENVQILYYFCVLFFAGLVTGILIGVISDQVIKRLRIFKEK